MPKLTYYKGKYGRTAKMTPRSARRVIGKYVRKYRGNFTKRVQKVLARNLKNTPTTVVKGNKSICQQSTQPGSAKHWFVWSPGAYVWQRPSGSSTQNTQNYPFEGDSIKLKKWWIKGTIAYDNGQLVSTSLSQSEIGYVDIYLMRTVALSGVVERTLPHFFQSGHDTVTPEGKREEMLYPVNKNYYKVYAHRRYKMGGAWTRQDSTPAVDVNEQNNDFDMAKTFSFDVTKYVCKDRRLKYNRDDDYPNDPLVKYLSVVVIFHPACGDLGSALPQVGTDLNINTWMDVKCCSWGEYESA